MIHRVNHDIRKILSKWIISETQKGLKKTFSVLVKCEGTMVIIAISVEV